MNRKQNFQTIAWFWDIKQRGLLDLDPPYQRRSVWNQTYRDFFVDTVLLGYPAPAIFLFENITPEGRATYHVVDGKQRLSTLFAFISNEFPIFESATRANLQGRLFRDMPDDVKREFWTYQFTVEYLASNEDAVISNIFDRINRNTAKLTPQELRNARFGGVFITKSEEAAEALQRELGPNFPNIGMQPRRQMKDVEFAANLLLLLEEGPQGYSASQLDEAFSARDAQWDDAEDVMASFARCVAGLKQLIGTPSGQDLRTGRLKNQADFYSLFGAVSSLQGEIDWAAMATRLLNFILDVSDETRRATNVDAGRYFEAARSASNDAGPRKLRIEILLRVMKASV
jgi:hypothetical protein